MDDLKNKIVWITGCSRGVGRELALSFAEKGSTVIATMRNLEAGDAEGLGEKLRRGNPKSLVLVQDVKNPEDAQAVAQKIGERFGQLDVLINNAAIDPRVPATEMTFSQWDSVLDANLGGSWHCCQAAMPLMRQLETASIINVGSITAHVGMADLTHYIASKQGLIGLTRGLARDLGPDGVRVNCMVLGAVMVAKECELGTEEEILDLVNQNQCIPGRIHPADIVPTFHFFASDASRPITGQSLHVDKGWTHH
jgi:NAD(P)-dependent dehydrogenase (short-subunit alcohol dehydrogenase family)